MYGLEQEILNKVVGEQHQKFKLQKDELDTAIERFTDYKKNIKEGFMHDWKEQTDNLDSRQKKVME